MSTLATVDVSKEDITRGQRSSPTCCPISLALSRVLGLPEGRHLSVGAYEAHIIVEDAYGPLTERQVHLPAGATVWMRQFDLGKKVEPFSFQVYLPDGLLP